MNSKQNSDSVFYSVVSATEPWPVSKAPTIQTSSNTSNQTTFHELPSSTSRSVLVDVYPTKLIVSPIYLFLFCSRPHLHPVGPSVGALQAEPVPFSSTSTIPDTNTVDNLKNDMSLRLLSSCNSKRDVRQEMFSRQALLPTVLSPATRNTRPEQLTNATTATPRSNTPNTLKKHSRGYLRMKPSSSSSSSSSSAFVPVGDGNNINERRIQEQARDAHTIMSMSGMAPALTPTPSVLDSSEESPFFTAGKLRGLARKLSSGGLRRRSSQSGRLRMLGRASTSSGSGGSLNGHGGKYLYPLFHLYRRTLNSSLIPRLISRKGQEDARREWIRMMTMNRQHIVAVLRLKGRLAHL